VTETVIAKAAFTCDTVIAGDWFKIPISCDSMVRRSAWHQRGVWLCPPRYTAVASWRHVWTLDGYLFGFVLTSSNVLSEWFHQGNISLYVWLQWGVSQGSVVFLICTSEIFGIIAFIGAHAATSHLYADDRPDC